MVIVATTFTLGLFSGVYNMVYDHSVPENISFFIVFSSFHLVRYLCFVFFCEGNVRIKGVQR